jgi:F-type H+-transporting ATPase subunit epsilon
MALPKHLRFVLVTPERTLLDEQVDALQFPLYDGQIGILPGRAPLIGRLGFGELTITEAQKERRFYVEGGFVQVKREVVSLLTMRAIPVEELDVGAAEAELREANARVPTTPRDFAAKERDVRRARELIAVARKAR